MANNTNWLNISSQSGSSGQTILTLSAQRNLSTDYKTAEITAYNPVYNISAKTYVTLESYTPYLTIAPALVGVPGSGGTYELHISANCSWVIAFPDLVSSFSTSAGTGNASITFTVPSTTADTTLVANIVVTDESGQISRICRIEQYGAGVHIGIYPVELYFDASGGSKTFTVTADCAYNIRMESGTTWATVEPQSGYTGQTVFTVTVNEENTGSTVRQGAVFIDAPGSDLAVILYQRKPETRLIATYYVTSTTNPTRICSDTSSFSKAEYPDGTEITLGTGYTFPSTGMQSVYYTLTGSSIGSGTFLTLQSLRSVSIPNGVTSIGDYCFLSSVYLSSVTLPNTLESIGTSCFDSCYNLSSITIPSSVTGLPNGAFNYCINLSSVTLESGLTQIGNNCFSDCEALSSITIPGSVLSIGRDCFSGSSVSSITFSSLTPPYLENTNALSSTSLFEIIVPCLAVEAYLSAWPQYSQYITCNDDTVLYFTTDTSNVAGTGETRTITILNNNVNPNRIGLTLPSDFPQQGSYIVDGKVIYLTYPANPSYTTSRSWTIGVVAQTVDGVSLSGSYRISQLPISIYSIPYTADTSIVDYSGETRTITIDTSNLVASSITIGIEGATGVTYTYQNGVITLVFPNSEGKGKNITVTITGETIDGEGARAVVTYTQEGDNTNTYLTFDIVSGGNITWKTSSTSFTKTIWYRKNNATTWKSITSTTAGTSFSVNAGDKVQFKGNNAQYGVFLGNRNYFGKSTASFKVRGNIMSLIDSTGFTGTTTLEKNSVFYELFAACKGLTDASNLILPATTLSNYCYAYMFYGCTNLTIAPELPATNLSGASWCYDNMFYGCTSLTTAPELPATTLSRGCYAYMFYGCTGLTTAPAVLPALTVIEDCYGNMFNSCSSLTRAPELPAATLVGEIFTGPGGTFLYTTGCYQEMFAGCISLSYIKCLATDISAPGCTWKWVQSVQTNSGTFVKAAPMNDWTTGVNGIPTNWTVQDAT